MSMTIAAASLGLAGACMAGAYIKQRYDQNEIWSRNWASRGDVKSWGLIGQHRVDERNWPVPAFVYGSMKTKSNIVFDWTMEGSSRHALVSAPSGAGKTWTVFYPTMMFGWTHSCVVHVRKKEMAELTAGFRSTYSDVIWMDPTSMGSAKYNPMDRIRAEGIYAIRDTQNLVEALSSASSGGKGDSSNAVFLETAKDFSSAAIVYVKTHLPVSQRNFRGLREAFSNCAGLAARMLENTHPHPDVRDEIRISAMGLLNNPSERFIGNVEALMRSWLRVYQDTILSHITSSSDFSPEDLVTGNRPVTLYIHLPPNDDERLAPFVNLIISQIIDDLMTWEKTTRDGNTKRWQVAWIIDEAWRLGKIAALEGALADMRSYGMRALLGVQGLNQIIHHYGTHNSVFNNCRWITSWQNGFDECKHVADMLGESELVKKSSSTSYGVMGDPKGMSRSTTMEWRPVIQAAHVSRIPKDRIIIFGEEKPILARRTHPSAWQKLIRPLERQDRVIGNLLSGPPPPRPQILLPNLRRLIPAPPDVRLLPPPRNHDNGPNNNPDSGPSSSPPPASPKRPRRRL